MAFAGLWEVWRDPSGPDDGELLRTCAIVTTRANDLMTPIHERIPVVLAPKDWASWLDPASGPGAAVRLLQPPPSEWFEAFPVASLVNNVRNDGPELLDPLPPPPVRS
jgi:putative SOS response-associated peptidase YedK